MNNLTVKEVDFQGDTLLACEKDEKVYVAIRWVCEGIGLNENQMKRQLKNAREDLVVSKGVSNLTLPTNGGYQDVFVMELDFLPLWLAKISITPAMQKDSPFVVDKLVDYQLKAKDVLAQAFIKDNQVSNELRFLQGLLDGMKENELRVKKLEEQSSLTNNKVVHIETKLNNNTVEDGYKTSHNVARELGLYSTNDKPHGMFIDAVAKALKIYNKKLGYKDEYVNAVQDVAHGGMSSVIIYYSEKSKELIEQYLEDNFELEVTRFVRGKKKGEINKIQFQLERTYEFNVNTYNKYKEE